MASSVYFAIRHIWRVHAAKPQISPQLATCQPNATAQSRSHLKREDATQANHIRCI